MGNLSKIANTGSVLKIAGGTLKAAPKLRAAMREGFGDTAKRCWLALFINWIFAAVITCKSDRLLAVCRICGNAQEITKRDVSAIIAEIPRNEVL